MKIKIEDLKNNKNGEISLEESLKNNYKKWMNYRKVTQKNFMMVPKEFIESKYIQAINSNAISLYLYYIYRAKNDTGVSWPSISLIAEELGVSEKSINNWNKTLEEIGLIHREKGILGSKNTYLLPISDYLSLENKGSYKKFIEFSREKVDGKLVAAFHLFQWIKNTDSEKYDIPYNVICLVFRRTYKNPLHGREDFKVDKIVFFEEDVTKITFEESEIKDIIATFVSPEEALTGVDFEIQGIVINSQISLKKASDDLLESIESLTEAFISDGTGAFDKFDKLEFKEI